MATRAVMTDSEYAQKYAAELGDSARRSKWIGSVKDHESRKGETLITRDHKVIEHWAEERKAVPATVEGTERGGKPGVLRFDFPGGSELKEVSWEDWFATFDDRDIAMLFQEHKTDGSQSNFFQFVSPHREDG